VRGSIHDAADPTEPAILGEGRRLVLLHFSGGSSVENSLLVAQNAASLTHVFPHSILTKPENPRAADELIAGAERYLRPIPGILLFHIGKMIPNPRPVVEQSYQVALNVVFATKQVREAYRAHPLHKEFEEEVLKKNYEKCVVYDFE
jgi:hypothetical protein